MMYRYILPVFIISLLFSSCVSTERAPDTVQEIKAEPAPVVIIVEYDPAITPQIEEPPAATISEKPEVNIEEWEAEEEAIPVFSLNEISARQQSAVLTVSIPQNTDPSLLSIEGGGHVSEIRVSKDTAIITVAGLESLSSYKLSLCYEGESVIEGIEINTASFEGKYSWTAADGSESDAFVLDVVAAESDDYRYFIYLNPDDSAFPEGYGKNEIRIAPLVAAGEPSLDDTKYRNAPESYKWTNSKWNTGSMTPSRIDYVKPIETETKDEIRTLVASVALGFTAEADVRYVLHEVDGNLYLSFYNKMSPKIANNFIKKNPSPGIRPFEIDEYWYTLERVE